MERIFISRVQKELAAERRALKEYIQGDALLRRFFEVFLFEDLPASDRRADEVYLDQVDRCSIYIGLLGSEYGFEDSGGVSPTEREFDQATAQGKTRLIYVKGSDDKNRHPKMLALVRRAGGQLIRRRFSDVAELTGAVSESLADHLVSKGLVQDRPFEEQPCPGATLADLDPDSVSAFVRRAREQRQFPLSEGASLADVMTHLNLLLAGRPTKTAILLFGRNPQSAFPSAELRCMHFHGTEIARPVPFYQVFKGNLFKHVDQAIDFVLSKINRSVGTRAEGPQAPTQYELPKEVVAEAIVNAIAHRDYSSAAAIQVSVFADRVEVWNPGELPPPLTPERLRHPHSSIARNHRICEALFLARYIEKFGTGILMMIRESAAHGLPEPEFEQRAGEFVTTIWRDWLTPAVIQKFDLNARQQRALAHLKAVGRITSGEYRQLTGAHPRTSTRDLDELVSKGLLTKMGEVGRGAHYLLSRKPDINRTNRTSNPQPEIGQKPDKSDTGNVASRPPTRSAKKPAGDVPTVPSTKPRRKLDKPVLVKRSAKGPHRGQRGARKTPKRK
ncbi:putative transcriptional regulator [Verrucomicrobia bacterium]|nr:putative transcriptional regulator [Verrucomicrobiota bacterium]